MTVFQAVQGPYSEHIGGAWTHPHTAAVYWLTTWRENSKGPYRLQVWTSAPPYTTRQMLREWVTGSEAAGPGPWGHGSCTWLPNGSLFVVCPGGVESSAVTPAVHIEPNLFPPIDTAAGGAYVPCSPGRYSAAIDGQAISGGRAIDVAALFTVPPSRAYAVRLVAQATAPNVRVRLGTEAQPGEYTINTQVANLQIHQVGVVNADSGGRLWLSVVDGAGQNAQAQVWLKVNGYWPG
jgi:hypothetical protein